MGPARALPSLRPGDVVLALALRQLTHEHAQTFLELLGQSGHAVLEAAAMIVPAVPIVVCQLSHLVSGDVGRAYMPVSMFAMIALIAYRRSEYAAAARHG